jgi:hypothetical protein
VYYNVLAGRVEGRYELDYWTLSTYGALEELIRTPARNQSLPLVIAKPETPPFLYPVTNNINALPRGERETITYTEDTQSAPYLIYNTTYSTILELSEPKGSHKLVSVRGYGRELASIYEIDLAG